MCMAEKSVNNLIDILIRKRSRPEIKAMNLDKILLSSIPRNHNWIEDPLNLRDTQNRIYDIIGVSIGQARTKFGLQALGQKEIYDLILTERSTLRNNLLQLFREQQCT